VFPVKSVSLKKRLEHQSILKLFNVIDLNMTEHNHSAPKIKKHDASNVDVNAEEISFKFSEEPSFEKM